MRLTCKLAPVCLLFVLCCLLLPGAARAQEPDFSGTTDILNGQTHLLRNDDIVVAYPKVVADGQGAYDTTITSTFYWTANSAISGAEDVDDGPAKLPTSVLAKTQVEIGRMFNLPNDVAAVVAVDGGPPLGNYVLSATFYDHVGQRSIRKPLVAAAAAPTLPAAATMADVTGDGYDDLVVSYDQNGGKLQVIHAANPNDWNAGIVVGPVFDSPVPFGSLAAGNVDGSGPRELIAVKDGVAPEGTGAELAVLNVNPQTLAVTELATTTLGVNSVHNSIVTGDFDGVPADDEAVVAAAGNGSSAAAVALWFDFDAGSHQGALQAQQPLNLGQPNFAATVKAVTGSVPWYGNSDAVAIMTQGQNSTGLYLYQIVEDKFSLQAYEVWEGNGYTGVAHDLAFGRFDRLTPAGEVDPDLQLMLLRQDDSSQAQYSLVRFDIVNGSDGLDLVEAKLDEAPFGDPAAPLTMAVGDLQGRSLRLGAPNKITVNHSSPRTTVGMPPMHLDWVVPSCNDPKYPENCTTPQQVEILAKPASNYAQLNTQVKASSQSSSKKTTSYSLSTKESIDTSFSYGIPDLASVSVEAKASAKQTYDGSVAATNSSYASVAFDASVRTGFADHIWFDNYRFNIWNYPVLGQSVCPAAKPNCTPAEKVPLHLQFSGPDQIETVDADASLVEWYQPVWEPGNLFSYPWTEAQLEALLPRSTVVNKSDVWAADSSGSNASVTWSQGSGDAVSQGSSTAYSSDTSVSVAAKASIEGFGFGAKTAFDVSTSSSTATLNTSSTTHGSSTGFSIAKTAQGVGDYVYGAQTYILGQAPLTGTLQTLPVSATVQTAGPLRLAFLANPYDSILGGDWWATTYKLPDVALNHPQRWTWTSTPVQPNIMTFNHVVTSTSPFDQEFYMMHGLYVTSLGAPDGPQLISAPLTQTVLLQARVYNYSHVDMDAPNLAQKAAVVRVRFYGQLFESEKGVFPVGGSFLIGEQNLAPIPGFASTTTPGDVPNWSMAVQPFDPTAFVATQKGGVYVRFWVVVWMEDLYGNLLGETPGHGLLSNPSVAEFTTMGDVPVEPYSNNVGSFKQTFFVQAPGAAAGRAANGAAGQVVAAEPPTVTLAAMQVVAPTPPLSVGPLGKHQVTATIRSGAEAEDAVEVLYYDGDPANGGKLFEWELLPHIAAGSQYVNSVTYNPQSCGAHTIYVTARLASGEVTSSTQIPNTPCTLVLPIIGKNGR